MFPGNTLYIPNKTVYLSTVTTNSPPTRDQSAQLALTGDEKIMQEIKRLRDEMDKCMQQIKEIEQISKSGEIKIKDLEQISNSGEIKIKEIEQISKSGEIKIKEIEQISLFGEIQIKERISKSGDIYIRVKVIEQI